MKKLNICQSNVLPVLLYKEPGFKGLEKKFMSESAYSEALTSLVIVCTDVLLVNRVNKTVYLAKRRSKPMNDWWLIGGRMYAGELPEESMARCFKRETSVEIEKNRFKFVALNRYFFKDRQQTPQNIGCDSLCYTFILEPTKEELNKISLDSNEYQGGIREFTRETISREKVNEAIFNLLSYIG